MIFLIGLLLFVFYFYEKQRLTYWKRKGVVQLNSVVPFFGHFLPVCLIRKSKNDIYTAAYKNYSNEKYVGVYEFERPVLVVRDLQMIQTIMIKDFSYFVNHPNWVFDPSNFIYFGTFNLTGDLWRAIRYKLTPTFTAGHLKTILPRLDSVISPPKIGVVEMREHIDICSADSIAAFFGTQITDKKDFQRIVKKFSDVNLFRFYKILVVEHFPFFAKLVGASLVPKKITDELNQVTDNMVGLGGSEFSSLLSNIMSKGKIEMKSKDFDTRGIKEGIHSFNATYDLLRSQAGQFLIASFDTTANSISFVAYDFCENPDKQRIASDEVRKILKEHNGKFSYEALLEMKYLGACLKESMRLHPVFSFAFREVSRDYQFENGLKMNVGEKILIPSLSLHMDPLYFPEPEKFLPERWLRGDTIHKCSWLPFGDGPRQCLAMRYAQLKMKIIIGKIIAENEISFNEKTKLPLKLDKYAFVGEMQDPLYVNVKPREQ